MENSLINSFKKFATEYHYFCKKLEHKYPNSQHVFTEEYTEAIDMEHQMSAKFGLPPQLTEVGLKFQEFAEFEECTEENIIKLYDYLKSEALSYLCGPVLTNVQFLKYAKANDLLSGEALPKMGFSCTSYSMFLYAHLYKRIGVDEKKLVHELELAESLDNEMTTKLSNEIDANSLSYEMIERLEAKGFQFTDQLKTYLNDQMVSEKEFSTRFKAPDPALSSGDFPFFISRIVLRPYDIWNEDDVTLYVGYMHNGEVIHDTWDLGFELTLEYLYHVTNYNFYELCRDIINDYDPKLEKQSHHLKMNNLDQGLCISLPNTFTVTYDDYR